MEILTDGDRLNPVWLKIKEHLEGRIKALHKELETPQSAEDTALLRGRIKEIRRMIDKAEPKDLKTRRSLPENSLVQ